MSDTAVTSTHTNTAVWITIVQSFKVQVPGANVLKLLSYITDAQCDKRGWSVCPGNSYWRGRLSTVYLLVKIGCFEKNENLVSV